MDSVLVVWSDSGRSDQSALQREEMRLSASVWFML